MHTLKQISKQALALMKSGGFPITLDVTFAVDKNLRFMGYTTEKKGKPHIVVAKWALSTDRALSLVIHELSHVYRSQTNHPSHDGKLHEKIINNIFPGHTLLAYQQETIYSIINNLQDLYADDISFAVYITHTHSHINEFFLGWVHKPIPNASATKDKWKNAESLLSAAFAQANLERHDVEDTDEKMSKAIKTFLKEIDKPLAEKFDFFKDMMVRMPSEISEKDFEKLLTTYITEFLMIT